MLNTISKESKFSRYKNTLLLSQKTSIYFFVRYYQKSKNWIFSRIYRKIFTLFYFLKQFFTEQIMANSRKSISHYQVQGAEECAIEAALSVIGGKWKMCILKNLRVEPLRYSELKRLVPTITEKMLIAQLRELESDGVVYRTMFAEIPPRVEYGLTEQGKRLSIVFDALEDWGTEFLGGKRQSQCSKQEK